MTKSRPRAKPLGFKRTKINFDEIKLLIDSCDYVSIAAHLYQNDILNPARFEIYKAVEHSYCPNPMNFDFSVLARYSISEIWHKMRAKEKREVEEKRKADARKRAGKKRK